MRLSLPSVPALGQQGRIGKKHDDQKNPRLFTAIRQSGLGVPGAWPVSRPRRGQCRSGPVASHARADRRCEEGGQDRFLHLDGRPGGRTSGRGIRSAIPRRPSAGRALRRRAESSSASIRNRPPAFIPRTSSRPATSCTGCIGSDRLGLRPMCPRMLGAGLPMRATPTASLPRPAPPFRWSSFNTRLVRPADAPASYADLLDAKWAGSFIKAHPAYSGNTMTATFILSRLLGWTPSRSSVSSASCRYSPQTSRRRSSRSASGRSCSMAPNTWRC